MKQPVSYFAVLFRGRSCELYSFLMIFICSSQQTNSMRSQQPSFLQLCSHSSTTSSLKPQSSQIRKSPFFIP